MQEKGQVTYTAPTNEHMDAPLHTLGKITWHSHAIAVAGLILPEIKGKKIIIPNKSKSKKQKRE